MILLIDIVVQLYHQYIILDLTTTTTSDTKILPFTSNTIVLVLQYNNYCTICTLNFEDTSSDQLSLAIAITAKKTFH